MVRLLFIFLIPFLFNMAGAQSVEVSVLEKQDLFKKEVERKIKGEILDPILGIDRSFVFVDVRFDAPPERKIAGRDQENSHWPVRTRLHSSRAIPRHASNRVHLCHGKP